MKVDLFRIFRKNDDGVSPVIGTIMMVAVTVVLAATVVAIMNGFGDESVDKPESAAFRVQAIDTNGNGQTDAIKITYMTGPSDVPNGSGVRHTVTNTVSGTPVAAGAKSGASEWNPGDFIIYNPSGPGSFFVTVTLGGNTLVDQTVTLDE